MAEYDEDAFAQKFIEKVIEAEDHIKEKIAEFKKSKE